MKLKLQRIITYLVLFFTLASTLLPLIQPIIAYAEDGVSSNLEKEEANDETKKIEMTENSVMESNSEINESQTEPSFEKEEHVKEDVKMRSGEELAARKDPYDVNGLTDEEIISLANYMYGDYAKKDAEFKLYVTNDKGKKLDIPFVSSYGQGMWGDEIFINWQVKKNGNWEANGSILTWKKMDENIAYCVEPATPFKDVSGFTPQTSFSDISSEQQNWINTIINFGAKINDSDEFYFATQMYVWEAQGYEIQTDLSNYYYYKDLINSRADNHRQKPSFDEQVYTVKVGETLEINDENRVFEHFSETANHTNAEITKEGNKLTIVPSINSQTGEIHFERNSPYSGNQYFWVKSGVQTVTTPGALESTHTRILINIIKTGSAAARKLDEEGNPLAGATFKFEYLGNSVERTTDSDGIARLDHILMGTDVTITEIRAPEGRVIDKTPQTVKIEVDKMITRTFTNRWAEQPIKLIKQEKDTNLPLKGVPFALYKVTGVTKIKLGEYKTDDNGEIKIDRLLYNKDGYIFQELEPLHGFLPNTTEYTFKVTPENDGKVLIINVYNDSTTVMINTTATGKNGEKFLDPTKEVELEDTIQYKWLFAGRTYLYMTKIVDQQTGEVLETLTGSFIPLAYEGFHVVKAKVDGHKYRDRTIVFYEYIYDTVKKKEVARHEDINDLGQTIKINNPEIKTKAQGEDGRQLFNPSTKVPVKETVTFTDLVIGHKYTTTVQGYKLSDHSPYEKASLTKTFIATKATMQLTFDFELDGKELQGDGIVFTEKLLYESEELATHEDLTNEEQTVRFTDPKIITKAHGKKDKQLFDPHTEVPVTETATLSDLIVGDEYKVIVQGYRLSTSEIYEEVKQELIFTATETEMEIPFEFILKGKDLAGDGIVFTETLEFEKETIAEHKDLSNEEQTIRFTDPKIKTKAFGAENKQSFDPLQKVQVKETAEITNLIIGHEYRVVVQGYRLLTGKPYEKVRKEITFTAEAQKKTIEVDFTLEGKELRGDGIVFTETLSHEDEVVATHDDLKNKNQTVQFMDPKITTVAQGKNGEKILEPLKDTIIKESATITGLVIGNQYTVNVYGYRLSDGSLINSVSNQKTFIADKTEVIIQFDFKIDGKLFMNDGIVFTETLETKNEIIATHDELKNEKQTVHFKWLTKNIIFSPKSTLPSTGEKVSDWLLIIGLFILGVVKILWKKRNMRIKKV